MWVVEMRLENKSRLVTVLSVQCDLNVTASVHVCKQIYFCNVNWWWHHLCINYEALYIVHISRHWTHSSDCIRRFNQSEEWNEKAKNTKSISNWTISAQCHLFFQWEYWWHTYNMKQVEHFQWNGSNGIFQVKKLELD